MEEDLERSEEPPSFIDLSMEQDLKNDPWNKI